MPIDIPLALSSLKAAIDAGKILRETDRAFDAAEFRLKIADLLLALSEARTTIAELGDERRDRDDEIARLRRELETRGATVFEPPFYWTERDGQREGPFCPKCHDGDGKLCRLIGARQGFINCPVCERRYDGPDRPRFAALEDAAARAAREAHQDYMRKPF